MFAFSFYKIQFKMKQNISLQELIAINNPSKAKALVVKYGYRPARNYNDLIISKFFLISLSLPICRFILKSFSLI